jgi:Leucine-rich repeat (LRR) protein
MTVLETLHMGSNNIKGMIPSTLKSLCSLQTINLGYNSIGGDITDIIERLPNCSSNKLQDLYLMETNITGMTLRSLLNLTNLSMLDISDNYLSGSVPVDIGTLKQLTELYIDSNSLILMTSHAAYI